MKQSKIVLYHFQVRCYESLVNILKIKMQIKVIS